MVSARDWPILVVALLFAGMGLVALAHPAFVLSLFDVSVTSTDGRNETRAVYGGYGLAMAVALWLALRDPRLRQGVLVCLALALLGMAGGRVASIALDGAVSSMTALFAGIELAFAGVLYRAREAASGPT